MPAPCGCACASGSVNTIFVHSCAEFYQTDFFSVDSSKGADLRVDMERAADSELEIAPP